MAYVSQELKKKLAPAIMSACKRHGVKATLSVDNHSTLVLTIKSGNMDIIGNANEVAKARAAWRNERFYESKDYFNLNTYHYKDHFTGKVLEFFEVVIPLMNIGNYDKSDIQTDYFHCGWYIDVNVGRWNKPYEITV